MELFGLPQRLRAESEYDVRDLERLDERDDPEAAALRAEFYKLDEELQHLLYKDRTDQAARKALEKERKDPDPIPAIVREAEARHAFTLGLTGTQRKRLGTLRKRMSEIEAIPGIIPKTGTARRRRRRYKHKKSTRSNNGKRTQKHRRRS